MLFRSTLLGHLETVEFRQIRSLDRVRFPIQYVIRPDSHFRGFAGQLASGSLRPGDALVALPSHQETRVKRIVGFDGDREQAFAPQSIAVQLENEIDLSRGDMLVSPSSLPAVSRNFSAAVVWLHVDPLWIEKPLLLKQTTRSVKACVRRILHRVNVNSFEHEPAERLEMNGIAEVEVETSQPLFLDAYTTSRATGSFILIDPFSNATVGAGMVRETFVADTTSLEERNPATRVAAPGDLTAQERHLRHGHKPGILLLGDRLSLAKSLERALFQGGFESVVVDGSGVASPVLAGFLTALYAAGLVVLCTNTTLAPEDLPELPLEDIFKATEIPAAVKQDAETNGAQLIQDTLSFAGKLRLSPEHKPAGKEF